MASTHLNRDFLDRWEAHVRREQERADAQIAQQIALGTRKQRRALPVARGPVVDRAPNDAELLPFEEYDRIIVSFSGGKDSLACLLHILDLGVPREKIELWHQCVDGEPGQAPRFFDWPITEDYCRAVAEELGIRLLFQWRIGGFEGEALKENARTAPVRFEMPDGTVGEAGGKLGKVTTRREFPKTGAINFGRWCSGILKIDVARLTLNNDPRFKGTKTLFIKGERGEESTPRSKYAEVSKHDSSTRERTITEWHPLLDWLEPRVWEIIARYRVRPHPAYYVGFSRVSCMPCIFGNNDQWATVKTLSPALMAKIAGYEHAFYKSPEKPGTIHPTKDVLERAALGISYLEEDIPMDEFEFAVANAKLAMAEHYPRELTLVKNWELPRGAGRHSGGPT